MISNLMEIFDSVLVRELGTDGLGRAAIVSCL
jgi:hypothetical protein